MYFLEDREKQGPVKITVYKGHGKAARAALEKIGISAGYGVDPVKLLISQPEYGKRFFIFNLLKAFDQVFDLISDSQIQQAKQHNRQLRTAIDEYYSNQH